MRLLVTGADGQVGRALAALAVARGHEVIALPRAALDVTAPRAVDGVLSDLARPGLAVVNAAAYTAVDRAEAEPRRAFAVNRDGAGLLARGCARHGVPLVHLSTDYVFDGARATAYTENAPVRPLGVYGESKAAGEAAVRDALERHAIVRTAWVFSAHGANFVRTVWRLAHERDALRVVADQWGHPTSAREVARGALAAASRLVDGGERVGTVHWGGAPLATWHALAEAVVEEAQRHGAAAGVRVEPIATAAYPTEARRPARVELDMGRAARVLGLAPAPWRPEVARVCAELHGAA